MRARAQSFVALVSLLACCAYTFALDPSLEVSQYSHTAWKVRDGFAKGEIDSIAQTQDGYLWLGTEFGLLRFDGVRAVPWQPPGNQHLPPGTVYSLLVSRNGTVWIGTSKGLASWKDGKLTRYPELEGTWIFALLEDRDGTLWAAASGGGAPTAGRLCAIRGDAVDCFGGNGQLGPGVFALHEDRRGNVWAGVVDGLWRWKPGPPKFFSLPGAPQGILALADDSDGTLLIGWRGGIFRFVDGKAKPYSLPSFSTHFFAEKMFRDGNDSLWIGTIQLGLVHVHQGRTDVFSKTDGLSGDRAYAIFRDREGSIWVSTTEGLDRFRDLSAPTLTTKQGLSTAVVLSTLSDKAGSVWLATVEGLNRWVHGRITIPSTGSSKRDGKLNGNNPSSLFQDDRGRIWVSTFRDFGYLEDGRFKPIKGVPEGWKLSITQDNAENLWVMSEQFGLSRISPQNYVLQIPWSSLGHKDHASVLAADRNRGGVWIGFFRGGIAYFSENQIRASFAAADGLGTGRVSDFYFDEEGTLWISTEGGLSRLKNNRVATLTSKNGLPCDKVHWAIQDNDHSLWLYTACGLIRIVQSELDAWAVAADKGQDTTRAVRVTVFDNFDGVKSLSIPSECHPQVAKTPDGKIWFLPWDGVSVIDPHHIPFNKVPPPVHIEQITADRKTYDALSDASENLRLLPMIHDLEIDYTALSLVAPEKNRFRYKLEGVDREWQDAGSRRQAFYTDLPPRHYRFRVAACNNSGVWNEEGAALDFVIPPAWYQTNWFRAACILVFLGMIWGIHELRVRQLAHQFNMRVEERVGERTRIARDLHDTLLQSFQGLLLQFKAVSYQLQPGKTKNALDAAIDEASQAITEGRDTVQGLRVSVAEKDDLAEAIRTFGEELASSASNQPPVAFEVMVEGRRKRKRPFLRDEVYRIAMEALRNAFHHARADKIEVELQYGDTAFTLRVRDNGRGIDRDVLSSGGHKGHFGLHGMRERAELAGGELAIWSEVDSGTEIELTIPASRAYTTSARRFWWFRKPSQKDPDVKEKVQS